MRFLVLLMITAAYAEQLPMVVLSARDGLPAATVHRIRTDSKGFIWIPHANGLTWYDGNTLHSFGRAEGLPSERVSDIVERRDGTYLLSSGEHLCVFDPRAGKERFQCESSPSGQIEAILEANGAVWVGTERGLWRREHGTSSWTQLPPTKSIAIRHLLQDKRGDVWVASKSGLFRFRTNREPDRWTTEQGLCDNFITAVNETPGSIWVGTQTYLFRFEVDAATGKASIAGTYGTAQGMPSGYTNDIRFWRGSVWAATFQGLARLLPSGRWQPVDVDPSVRDLTLNALAVDTRDELWLGTDGGGVARISGNGFSRFNENDGLPLRKVWSIFEDRKGDLMVITKNERDYAINRFDGLRFHAARLSNPYGSMFAWNWGQIALHSASGAWWLATSDGLLRYDRGLNSVPAQVGTPQGVAHPNISRIFEQRNGALWVSTYQIGSVGLYRRDPGARRFHQFDRADGLPDPERAGIPVSCFAEDQHGQVWIGLLRGGLLRYRKGRFEQFGREITGAPDRGVRALFIDSRGRLWIGTVGKGLIKVDNPASNTPVFVAYDRSRGLSDNSIHAIAEDRQGRIYAAGSGTIDRLSVDGAPGSHVRRYTTTDGVISGDLRVAFRDRHGRVWFGGDQGLCSMLPEADGRVETSVLIHSIRVNGRDQRLSDLGEAEPASLKLKSFERQLEVEFSGSRHDLLYQTRLLGFDQDWSRPSHHRTARYLSLAPGDYELLVRTIAPDGAIGARMGRLRFSVAAAIWQQAWFISLLTTAMLLLGYLIHRLVLARRLAVERVRSRIATDLHDDIGASLSRIAVMSEALQMRTTPDADWRRSLAQIAEESRGIVEDMSDIVWSIDPRRDTMADVVARLRAFGSGVLESRGIRWVFDAPEELLHHRLSPDQRRQLYLILKEAIHNVARHSRATSARLSIRLEAGSLRAEIEDDGCGYVANDGQRLGVHSMRNRAEHLAGAFHVAKRPEGGTRVSLRFPLAMKNA